MKLKFDTTKAESLEAMYREMVKFINNCHEKKETDKLAEMLLILSDITAKFSLFVAGGKETLVDLIHSGEFSKYFEATTKKDDKGEEKKDISPIMGNVNGYKLSIGYKEGKNVTETEESK